MGGSGRGRSDKERRGKREGKGGKEIREEL